jgi:hypothetical protein
VIEERDCLIEETWLVRGAPESPGILVHRFDEGEYGLEVPCFACKIFPAEGNFPEAYVIRLSKGAVAAIAALFRGQESEFAFSLRGAMTELTARVIDAMKEEAP